MTHDIAIRTKGLGKRYKLGALQPYRTLRDAIAGVLRRAPRNAAPPQYHWALRDIDLTVRHGEVLGIVGRNGSGKSTLLKLLTRITRPTEGRADIRGRIGALLEVGTGFHPELTGRENIFLNGSILGMSRAEIKAHFDEIVDFAGVEEYLDTPVKRYSSGMNVRLAFAVAAHLEPEILVVDEVLAVGDAAFQRKCLGRMTEIASEGRTVLFVSHQMEALISLCTRSICLSSGTVVDEGNPTDVVNSYLLKMFKEIDGKNLAYKPLHSEDPAISCKEFSVVHNSGSRILQVGETLSVQLVLFNTLPHNVDIVIRMQIRNYRNILVLVLSNNQTQQKLTLHQGTNVVSMNMHNTPLVPGRYTIGYSIRNERNNLFEKVTDAVYFEIAPGDYFAVGNVPAKNVGVFFQKHNWSSTFVDDKQEDRLYKN